MGEGSPDPRPTFCIVVGDAVVGWVDAEHEDNQHWLEPHEANLGYALHPDHRGHGYATRAVQLLMHHLAQTGQWSVATLAIDFGNDRSVGIATRCGFTEHGTIVGEKESRFFRKPVPPLTYTDGVATIRRLEVEDLDLDLEAKDEEQIEWLWEPGQRESWEAMTPEGQRDHARRGLEERRDAWGRGPKWVFAVDGLDAPYVAYVDCDLANRHVPHGEANIGYASHPAHRGRGYVSRGVRLAVQFLRDHTGAREAHIGVDARNEASLRVARAVGAVEVRRSTDELGRTGVHHVIPITR